MMYNEISVWTICKNCIKYKEEYVIDFGASFCMHKQFQKILEKKQKIMLKITQIFPTKRTARVWRRSTNRANFGFPVYSAF